MDNIEKLENDLWSAADTLRSNGNVPSNEYFLPVLGIIFLRHATNRYHLARHEIEAAQAAGTMPQRPLVKADFIKRRALKLPEEARFETLLNLPEGSNLAKALEDAMDAVERDFPPLLGQLPKEYQKLDNDLLEHLMRVFDSEILRTATGDIFGRIYEYFLMKFSMVGAHDNGEFFTPPSLVQTIVNVIEPDHGVVFDPACGSGGMFAQSSHFIEGKGEDTSHKVTFYGQEKTGTTVRLAKMNLAVHGLEGDIREANSYYADEHELVGKCDFVMANPPFNVDAIDAEKIKTDRRLPFGLPGVNKAKKVSNGNYVWISYFHAYLKPGGRAGFVMSSQASSAGNQEAEVRRKLVETGDVDVMISIRSNFFYTRAVPCELWFLDKGKPEALRDTVLMIDARNIYRKVTRKIYDFTPEHLKNLTAIVWLYRGQNERFEGLLTAYSDNWRLCRRKLDAQGERLQEGPCSFPSAFKGAYLSLKAEQEKEPFYEQVASLAHESDAILRGINELKKLHETRNHDSEETRRQYPKDASAFRKHLQNLLKLGENAVTDLKKKLERPARLRLEKQWNEAVKVIREVEEILHDASYWAKQLEWLKSRFPESRFVAVAGLCKAVTRAEIKAADWSLTPGRYVGVAPAEEDEDFDFEQTIRDIHSELADLNDEATTLAAKIQANFKGLAV